jgi:hypothetical protein
MPAGWSRRRVLAVVGAAAAGSGCLGGAPRVTDEPAGSTRHTTTTSEMPAPASTMPAVSGFPAEFDGTVSLSAGEAVGWSLGASFTAAVDVSVSTDDNSAASVYVTDRRLATAAAPEKSVWAAENADAASEEGVELTDGGGSVVLTATGATTVNASVEATLI